jgi:transposase
LLNDKLTPLQEWLSGEPNCRTIIKSTALLAIERGIKIDDICNVLNVTRESLRLWRKQYESNGLSGLFPKKKPGRRKIITNEIAQDLTKILSSKPQEQSIVGEKWTGILVKEYIMKRWGVEVSLRTSLFWMHKLKTKI